MALGFTILATVRKDRLSLERPAAVSLEVPVFVDMKQPLWWSAET